MIRVYLLVQESLEARVLELEKALEAEQKNGQRERLALTRLQRQLARVSDTETYLPRLNATWNIVRRQMQGTQRCNGPPIVKNPQICAPLPHQYNVLRNVMGGLK